MEKHHNIYRLNGKIQHYEWGGTDFIPSLLRFSNDDNKPCAEYWLGTHHLAMSEVQVENKKKPLRDLVELPYLLKVLDVKGMLSIQVHPSKKGAEKGFRQENEKGIPLDARNRNYRDDNHKPELIVALGEFWLLHGFKKSNSLLKTLKEVPELKSLAGLFEEKGYQGLYENVMSMPREKVNRMLKPLLERILPLYNRGSLKKSGEDFWAARAALTFNKGEAIDRGLFSIYFFNLVRLEKGDGLYQAAGLPHAYLEGRCMEIMSNSDNVLRGGLTTKHIDVPELMKHVKCEPVIPAVIKYTPGKEEMVYETPVEDFNLSVFHLGKGKRAEFTTTGPEIIFVYSGEVYCSSGNEKIDLTAGQSMFIKEGTQIILSTNDKAEFYRANSLPGKV